MKYKVRIKKAAGGPVNSTMKPADRSTANIEAEKGETALADFDGDGMLEHMKIGGKRHSQGGTPLNVPEGTFIFSDTNKMKLGGDIVERFGKNPNKKYTPAKIAKQYDINKYKQILEDPKSDVVKKRTAQLMIDNYNKKLGELALVQESKKGFPQGIPAIAMPLLGMGPEQEEGQGQPTGEMRFGGDIPKASFGANYFADGPILTPARRKLLEDQQKLGYNVDFSPRMDRGDNDVPDMQHRNGQLYGAVKNNDLGEFKKRHEWYFRDKKNWDASKDADVRDFQTTYDQYASNNKISPYFDGTDTSRRYSRKDGKFGEYTYNAPAIELAANAHTTGPSFTEKPFPTLNFDGYKFPWQQTGPAPEEETATKPEENVDPLVANNPAAHVPPYWQQDKMNLMAGIRNKMNVKKYLPYEPVVDAQTVNPTFYDPNRELAANAEMAQKQMDANGAFAGPTGGRNSAVTGQALENAGNILGKYNNMNVGVENQFAGVNADIMNKEGEMNAARLKSLYNGNVIANQQYDNSMAQADDVIRKNAVGAVTNRQQTQWLCEQYPQYCVDNRGFVDFTKGKNWETPAGALPGTGAIDQDAALKLYADLKVKYPTASEAMLKSHVEAQLGMGRSTDTDSDGIANKTTSAGYNQLMQLMRRGQQGG